MHLRPWISCVEINHQTKNFYLRQVEAFDHLDPLLVVWRDRRTPDLAEWSQLECVVIDEAWKTRPPAVRRALRQIGRVAPVLATSNFEGTSHLAARLDAIAQNHPPSVIYAHTGFVAVKLAPWARARGVPLVAHFHGHDINLDDRAYRRLLVASMSTFDQIIVVGQWMVEEMLALGAPRSKLHVIPMGTELSQTPTEPELTVDSRDRFICVARLVKYQGVDCVLRAFSLVKSTHPDSTLLIVGDGPERQALQDLTSGLDLSDSVTFVGELTSAETREQMRRSNVLVHHPVDEHGGPEAFGLVVTEAMAAGLPVVASRCGGLLDQVVDGITGILVEQNGATARAMRELIDDPNRARSLGSEGRVRASERFSSTHLAREVEEILSGVSRRDGQSAD